MKMWEKFAQAAKCSNLRSSWQKYEQGKWMNTANTEIQVHGVLTPRRLHRLKLVSRWWLSNKVIDQIEKQLWVKTTQAAGGGVLLEVQHNNRSMSLKTCQMTKRCTDRIVQLWNVITTTIILCFVATIVRWIIERNLHCIVLIGHCWAWFISFAGQPCVFFCQSRLHWHPRCNARLGSFKWIRGAAV